LRPKIIKNQIYVFKWSFIVFISVLDPDLDPCGSVLKWLPRMWIHIGNTDPDPVQSIGVQKGKKNEISSLKENSPF